MRQRKNRRPRHEGAHSWWGGDRRAWRWRPNHENIERKQEHCGGRIVVESDAAELWRDGIHAGCGIPDYSGEPERDGSAGGEELCAAGRCAGEIDIVNVFRRAEDVAPVVKSAVRIGVKVVWMQTGIENEEAAEKARGAGLVVIEDACILVEHRRRVGELKQ